MLLAKNSGGRGEKKAISGLMHVSTNRNECDSDFQTVFGSPEWSELCSVSSGVRAVTVNIEHWNISLPKNWEEEGKQTKRSQSFHQCWRMGVPLKRRQSGSFPFLINSWLTFGKVVFKQFRAWCLKWSPGSLMHKVPNLLEISLHSQVTAFNSEHDFPSLYLLRMHPGLSYLYP